MRARQMNGLHVIFILDNRETAVSGREECNLRAPFLTICSFEEMRNSIGAETFVVHHRNGSVR
jgi:hypothetical protein